MAIPADAPNKESAYKFLNYLMEPNVIAAISDTTFYANANKAATLSGERMLRNNAGIYPADEVMANLFIASQQ